LEGSNSLNPQPSKEGRKDRNGIPNKGILLEERIIQSWEFPRKWKIKGKLILAQNPSKLKVLPLKIRRRGLSKPPSFPKKAWGCLSVLPPLIAFKII